MFLGCRSTADCCWSCICPCVASPSPAADDGGQCLKRLQLLWTELQAARKDPMKYEALVERIRREADAFRHVEGAALGHSAALDP